MLEELKEKVCRANLDLVRHGLVIFTWGNVSAIDRSSNLVVIKIKCSLAVLFAALSAVSCTKEIQDGKTAFGSGPHKGNLIINAVTGSLGKSGPQSKAAGSFGYDVLWEEDDRISVIDSDGNAGLFELINGAGRTLGKFRQTEGPSLSGGVSGYYPASLLLDDGTLCWPSEQEYSDKLTLIPMAATAAIADGGGTDFNFKNLGGVLQLVLTSKEDRMQMESITVSAGNAGMSGAFTISDDTATGFAPGTCITLDCNSLVIGAAARTVYLAIPAGDYSDVRLTFTTKDGRTAKMSSESLSIKRSVVSKVTLAISGFKSGYPEYLSFTAVGADVPVGLKKTGSPATAQLEYSLDLSAGEWTSWTADASVGGVQTMHTLEEGQTLFLRTRTSRETMSGWTFDFGSGKVAAGGSVMSLLDPSATSSKVGDSAFAQLFKGAARLTSAPALPAMNLGAGCYESMFEGCTCLTEAPELPAAYLAECCYKSMFKGSGLVCASDMRASTLAENCCEGMYSDCKSLVSVRTLTATELAPKCYFEMFKDCSSLIEAPILPARKLTGQCYRSMFEGCTSLVKACQLPAMTLAPSCYLDMFSGCSSLSEAPALPATALQESCYNGMFTDCSCLVRAPELPATTLALACYAFMFQDCTSLEYSPYLPAKSLSQMCYLRMFDGCEKLKCVSVNFSDWMEEKDCTSAWIRYAGTSGTFYCPSGLDAGLRDNSHIPSGWAVITDRTPSKVGDLYWSEGVEGVYIGSDIVFATCNWGTHSSNEPGTAYTKEQLGALTVPSGWELPREADFKALEDLAGLAFADDGKGATKMIVESIHSIGPDVYWYYIPYTHNVEYEDKESGQIRKGREARLWMTGSAPYDFYWFRSDNWHGKTDLDSSSNYLRLVKRL